MHENGSLNCTCFLQFLIKCRRSLSPYFAGLGADLWVWHLSSACQLHCPPYSEPLFTLTFYLNMLFFKFFVFHVSLAQWLGRRSSYCPRKCCVKRTHRSLKHILPFYRLMSLINTDKQNISQHTEPNKWIKMNWADSADSWTPFASLEMDTGSDSIGSEIAKLNIRRYFLHRGNSA